MMLTPLVFDENYKVFAFMEKIKSIAFANGMLEKLSH